MKISERWETLYQAARVIRAATGHDEFTVNDLRRHMSFGTFKTKTENGVVYVDMLDIERLIYRLGIENY